MVVRPSPDGGARATAWGWAVLVVLFAAQAWVLYREMPPGGEGLFPGADKVAHVLLFAAPALLAARRRLPGGVLLVGLHALASEPLQGALTLTRTPDVWDTACDLAGICLGLLVAGLLAGRVGAGRVGAGVGRRRGRGAAIRGLR